MKNIKNILLTILTITVLVLACDDMISESSDKVSGKPSEVTEEVTEEVIYIPAGFVSAYMGENTPEGWIPCDGRELSRVNYSRLYAAIGDIYGNGDGSTTFNAPDLRGTFLRGIDNGSGRDVNAAARTDRGDGTTGDNVGTYQADAFQGHEHGGTWRYNASGTDSCRVADSYKRSSYDWTTRSIQTKSGYGTPRISSETRPKNISVRYMIKD